MAQQLKLFEDWGIALQRNLFLKARLKLTFLYVLTVAVLVCGFSLFIFSNLSHNLSDSADDDFATPSARTHFIQRTIQPLGNTLVVTDILLILTAAGLSYWLAGRTLKPVQRALEAQRVFAANASHELRTPLAVIQNDSEVTLRNSHASTAELRATLSSTIEEVGKMSRLVEDLLVMARSEHAKLASVTAIDLQTLQTNILSKLQPLATKKGLALESSWQDDLYVRGNAHALERIFVNIIQNSIEHTPPGGVVTVASRRADGKVLLRFTDTGVGIAAIDLPHIFDRFYKGRQKIERNTSGHGNGLGLAIVKEIVAQHNGTISIESVEHAGTSVFITLP